MITLKQFLNENETAIETQDPNEIVRMIKHDCRKWLNEINDVNFHLIFRGMKIDRISKEHLMYKKDVRTDRSPKDTRRDVHILFDKYFKHNFGVKYRSESIFISGDKNISKDYGHPFIIFPIGDYDYCWSSNVNDLTYYFEQNAKKIIEQMFKDGKIEEYEAEKMIKVNDDPDFNMQTSIWNITKTDLDVEKIINEILEKANYTNRNLKQAIVSGNEIMISCKSYYVMNNITEQNEMSINEILDLL